MKTISIATRLGRTRTKGGGGWTAEQLDEYLATLDRSFIYDFSAIDRHWETIAGISIADTIGDSIAYAVDSRGGSPSNLLLQQEQLDGSSWLGLGATVSANADGIAEKIRENSGTSNHYVAYYSFMTGFGTTTTFSAELKQAERRYAFMRPHNNTAAIAGGRGAYFDLQDGVVSGVGSGVTASVSAAADGYWRCAVTATWDASGTVPGAGGPGIFISDVSSGSAIGASYTGDGTSGILVRKAQLQVGSLSAYQKNNPSLMATANFQPKRQANGAKFDGSDDRLVSAYALSGTGDLFAFDFADIPASLASTQILFGCQDGSSNGAYLGVTTAGALRAKIGQTVIDSTGIDLRGGRHSVGVFTVGATAYLVANNAIVGSGAWTGSLPTTAWTLGAVNANGTPSAFFGGSLLCPVHGRDTINLTRAKQIAAAIAAKGA